MQQGRKKKYLFIAWIPILLSIYAFDIHWKQWLYPYHLLKIVLQLFFFLEASWHDLTTFIRFKSLRREWPSPNFLLGMVCHLHYTLNCQELLVRMLLGPDQTYATDLSNNHKCGKQIFSARFRVLFNILIQRYQLKTALRSWASITCSTLQQRQWQKIISVHAGSSSIQLQIILSPFCIKYKEKFGSYKTR